MLAFAAEKALRCSMCGTADWEWEEDFRRYEPVTVRCYGCYLKEVAGAEADKQPGVRVELMLAKGDEADARHNAERKIYEASRSQG